MTSIKDIFLNPREFLKMNLLLMFGNGPNASGTYKFRAGMFTRQDGFSCTRASKFFWKSNYDIGVWGVWPEGSPVLTDTYEELPVFWLPFSPNSKQKATLDNMAPFMLTASMTGCTFGAASFKSGLVEVCHVNYQNSETGQLDKGRMAQETQAYSHRLEDSRYRENVKGKAVKDIGQQARMGATVVGVNSNKGWKFFAQQWENLDGTNYKYHKLLDV